MNVLIINYEFPPIGGGAGKASYNLGRQLAAAGHRVDVLTSRMTGQPSNETLDGMTVFRVRSWRKGIHDCGFRGALTYLFFAIAPFLRITRKNTYDLIHYFFGLPTGFLALLPGPHRKIPYIVSLRGSDVPGYDEYNKPLEMVHRLAKPVTKKIWKNAREIVAVTTSLKCKALQTLSKAQIRVIPNGVDSFFLNLPKPENSKDKRFKLISVARLIERKGIQDVLKALAELADPDTSLLVVGEGNYMGRLKKLSSDLSLDDRVSFYGFCHPHKLPDLLMKSDAFILPSRVEAFGNVFAEAMACGLPVIGSDAGGIPDLVGADNGMLVKPGDIAMIKRAIASMKASKEKKMQMGAVNRKKILEEYSWESITNQYISLYHDAING
ncbi:MAG: glycosyltransferase [Desulfobacterales bacterium]|nr:glycosyltransferase [Desulfobacterales bacterium]